MELLFVVPLVIGLIIGIIFLYYSHFAFAVEEINEKMDEIIGK